MARSSEDKVLAGITHLGVMVGWMGLLLALVIYLLRKDQSLFVKRSTKQAMGYQICVLVIMQVLVLIFGGSMLWGIMTSSSIASGTLGLGLAKVINLILCALGIWGAIRAFLGENFRYPVIGDFLERL